MAALLPEEMFRSLPEPFTDQIFALTARYQDARKRFERGETTLEPFTLGIGKYINEDGKTPLMRALRQALQEELQKRADNTITGGYLPILGGAAFRGQVEDLVLGS